KQPTGGSKSAAWFIHIQGENLGPLPLQTIKLMLSQNRLQFADYIWGPGLNKWERIYELDEFAALLPGYPKQPIPKKAALVPQSFEEEVEGVAEASEEPEEQFIEEVEPPKPAPRTAKAAV